MGQNNQNRNSIRASVRPDIQLQPGSLPNVAAQLEQRMTRVPLPARFENVRASVEAGEVVLRGEVATDADKRLMERLVNLEPGVDSVRNELIVQSKTLEQIPAEPNR